MTLNIYDTKKQSSLVSLSYLKVVLDAFPFHQDEWFFVKVKKKKKANIFVLLIKGLDSDSWFSVAKMQQSGPLCGLRSQARFWNVLCVVINFAKVFSTHTNWWGGRVFLKPKKVNQEKTPPGRLRAIPHLSGHNYFLSCCWQTQRKCELLSRRTWHHLNRDFQVLIMAPTPHHSSITLEKLHR